MKQVGLPSLHQTETVKQRLKAKPLLSSSAPAPMPKAGFGKLHAICRSAPSGIR